MQAMGLYFGYHTPTERDIMVDKVKAMPVWQPTKQQREWIDKQAEQTGGGVTQVIRNLVTKAMKGKK